MPRRLIKKLTPHPSTLQGRWFIRIFGAWLADPGLWSLQRRSVTAAFGMGLAICFVPLPVHLPLAVLCAVLWRFNIPTIIATTFIVNPLTVVPIYYAAYRVGAALLRDRLHGFAFEPSWTWLRDGLGPTWKPFLLGCFVCAIVAGLTGRIVLEFLWRRRVVNDYRARKRRSSC
jgi:uncharacterized protein (DUF2062 family)